MGISSILGSIFGGAQVASGPSAAELQAQQEAAAQKERDRIRMENEAKKKTDEDTALAKQSEDEAKRRAFAGGLTEVGDEEERRKYLKKV